MLYRPVVTGENPANYVFVEAIPRYRFEPQAVVATQLDPAGGA